MSIQGGLAVEKTGYGQYEVVRLNHKGIGRDVLPLVGDSVRNLTQ